MLINLSESNSILNRFVSELRNVKIQNDRMRFRRNMERIGEIIAYEISRTLNYVPSDIETPLGVSRTNLLSEVPLLGTILRAGLPLHQGLLNYFDHADNAFVSAYRHPIAGGSFEIKLEYCAAPSLEGRVLIVSDPMLATGASMVLTLKELLKLGKPKEIHVASAIACRVGIDHLLENLPQVKIWAASIDQELNDKAFIVPGLGDAGDLAFGTKGEPE